MSPRSPFSDDAKVRVLEISLGSFPKIEHLNPSLRTGSPKIKVILQVQWKPRDPVLALATLQNDLVTMFPSLSEHDCRGPSEYHLRALASRGGVPTPSTPGGGEIDAAVALAHTIEHVMIDAISFVTGAPIISGVTAALRDSEDLFDVIVECPDPIVGRLAIHVSLFWIMPLLRSGSADPLAKPLLELARTLYNQQPRSLDSAAAASSLGLPLPEVIAALQLLEGFGYACPVVDAQSTTPGARYAVCEPWAADGSI